MTPDDITARLALMQAIWDNAGPPPMLTAAEIGAGDKAERRAEDDRYELAHLEDREEMNR